MLFDVTATLIPTNFNVGRIYKVESPNASDAIEVVRIHLGDDQYSMNRYDYTVCEHVPVSAPIGHIVA